VPEVHFGNPVPDTDTDTGTDTDTKRDILVKRQQCDELVALTAKINDTVPPEAMRAFAQANTQFAIILDRTLRNLKELEQESKRLADAKIQALDQRDVNSEYPFELPVVITQLFARFPADRPGTLRGFVLENDRSTSSLLADVGGKMPVKDRSCCCVMS
jgi:hypothetical protein